MIQHVTVRPSAYYDSVTLMLVSREVEQLEGVDAVAAVTGTPLNLSLLADQGYELNGQRPGPNDLVIAIRAREDAGVEAALAAVADRLLHSGTTGGAAGTQAPPRSLAGALRLDPELNLAVLSVPGRHVAYEAAVALRGGLHVFCFSDGVGIEEELALKDQALERGLLFMGPDCGTAILDGVALGFANVVERGPVGLVGASGTGLQQVMCLLDAAGVGISQAIGVGGRDLSERVGGRMTSRALELLGSDPETEVIVLVSKPPDPAVAERITRAAGALGKPVVVAYLGAEDQDAGDGVTVATTLEQAAAAAATLVGATPYAEPLQVAADPPQGYVRGLFCGGTLCDEAMAIAARRLGRIASNIPLRPHWALADAAVSEGHTFIDFGEDEFTEGRAHPMIDPALRTERLVRDTRDPEVGVVLLDVLLGHGAHPDPASELAPVIAEALERRGEELRIVVSLCGTERDPQYLGRQRDALQAAGAVVVRGNAQAARIAIADLAPTGVSR